MAYSVGVQRPEGPWGITKRSLFYLVLILYSIITAIPFIWGLLTSFKTLPESARSTPTGLPLHWTLDAWTGANGVLTAGSFPRWFLNSVIVATLVMLGNLFFDSLAGYAFARMRFPGRNALFFIFLGTMMVPATMTMVPVFIILVKMPGGSWVDTYQGLAVPFMVSAFGIFLMRQFFMALPVELEEAARIDGLSRFGIYWRIAVPLARPALATLGILQFQGNWDSFLMPSFIATSNDHLTLPVGLAHYSFAYQTFYPEEMAGAMIVILPILVIYLFAQRFFIEGVASAGVKG
ncbi:MAG: carbohydrate ABC transporter permease [Chloroflexi bacterium]|nr:carbohydrate ABC transporter permease [Chloroflexota bacterium]